MNRGVHCISQRKENKANEYERERKTRLKSSMFKISWKVELLVKNGYIEWVKHALRASAKAERNKRNSCVLKHRSELIQGRIHVEKRFISICYALLIVPLSLRLTVLVHIYSERLQHENKSACTVVPHCDKEAPLHAHCFNRERDGEYDDVNAVYVVDAIRVSSVLLHCEMRIITIKITHSKNRP